MLGLRGNDAPQKFLTIHMSDKASASNGEKAPIVGVQMDTTKDGVHGYLKSAGTQLKEQPYSTLAMRLALCRWVLDAAGISDKALRAVVWKQFSATPGWFGTNASQARQALGYAPALKTAMEGLGIEV